MKKTTKKTAAEEAKAKYEEAKRKFAREHTESFLTALEKIGNEMGLKITPIQYVKAYKLCIEKYKFGYPAEFKIAELISDDDTYEQTLAIMTAVIKKYRLAFQQTWKKNTARSRCK